MCHDLGCLDAGYKEERWLTEQEEDYDGTKMGYILDIYTSEIGMNTLESDSNCCNREQDRA